MSTSKGRSYQYEVMFLVSQSTATDMKALIEHIENFFNRAGVTVHAFRKWDERRLAYEIDKQKRGTYLLAYFSADPSRMPGFERDCNLSESIMRTLITRCDHLTMEEMQSADGRRELEIEANLRGAPRPAPVEAPAEAQPA